MRKIYLFLILLTSLRGFAQTKVDTIKKAQQTDADSVYEQPLRVETLENNYLGYTWDSDDQPFLDFKLSLTFRLSPFDHIPFTSDIHFYLAFTGRFAQYIGDRHSAPVVGKRFNPQFYAEFKPQCRPWEHSKLRFIYGHESNGQGIDSASVFLATTKSNGGNTDQAIDYISRGWDFFGISFIKDWWKKRDPNHQSLLELEIDSRYYLNWGVFEGTKEEYRDWESGWYGRRFTRNDVSGLAATVTYFATPIPDKRAFGLYKIILGGETGIAKPLTANSLKIQGVFKILYLPLGFSYANGYNGDIAQYGKRNSSFCISYVLTSFDRPFFHKSQ